MFDSVVTNQTFDSSQLNQIVDSVVTNQKLIESVHPNSKKQFFFQIDKN